MRRRLLFLTVAGPVGLFAYMVGWWAGYRTAISEWKQERQGS